MIIATHLAVCNNCEASRLAMGYFSPRKFKKTCSS